MTTMETYIYTLTRETKIAKTHASNMMKDDLCNLGFVDVSDLEHINEETATFPLAAIKGKGGKTG